MGFLVSGKAMNPLEFGVKRLGDTSELKHVFSMKLCNPITPANTKIHTLFDLYFQFGWNQF